LPVALIAEAPFSVRVLEIVAQRERHSRLHEVGAAAGIFGKLDLRVADHIDVVATAAINSAVDLAAGAVEIVVVVPPAGYEFDIRKELADACVQAGVGHVVFSSLENVDSITGASKFAPHFTDKARVEAYIRELPI
jgi:hypothetical protein